MHNKEHEKMMTELTRLIGNQENLTQADLERIVNQFNSGKTIPKTQLTPQQQAEDLIYEAYELFPKNAEKALAKIEKALKLNPDCIEAYEWLANHAPDLEMHLDCLQTGIEIGMEIFGGKYLEKNKGHFWGLTETRPFMRCLQQLADAYLLSGNNIADAVAILEMLLDMNPNDNQGARYQLLPALLELNEDKKFNEYDKLFKDEKSTFLLFNRALFAFKTKGKCVASDNKLKAAIAANKYVAKKLLSKSQPRTMADSYTWGDENEAKYYVIMAKRVWQKTTGALEWLASETK
jgi:tetratricopeptide (TPR) repeat protein